MDKNKKGGAMNDFDFEELDKAVTSLAAKTKTENNLPAASNPSPVTVTPAAHRTSPAAATNVTVSASTSTPPPTPRGDAGRPSQGVAAATPVSEPAVQPTVQHAKRLSTTPPKRRGAFMDIMAPNKASTRRTGATLQPLSIPADSVPQVSTPETPQQEPAILSGPDKAPDGQPVEAKNLEDHAPEIMTKEVLASEPEPKTVPKNPEAHPSTAEPAWHDPLDFQDLNDDKSHKDKEDKPAPAQTSPFLPEAKVEKRPLGAFSSFEPKQPVAVHEPGMPANAPDLIAEDELTPEPTGTFKEPEVSKAPTMHDAPKESPKLDDAKPDMHSQAMMSIPKQYHTEQKPVDTAKRPIFDTKEYHPPLLEAAAHDHRGGNSMWSKLFIALATLVLLGVAGYFAYLYFVQQ